MFNQILLVDNDSINNYLSCLALRSKYGNVNIIIKRDGKDALNYLRICSASDITSMPDLIILDTMMPIMDGFELLEDPLWKSLCYNGKIVILTEHLCFQNRKKATELGLKHLLEKPLSAEKLEGITNHKMSLYSETEN